jgi:hypothetical protein
VTARIAALRPARPGGRWAAVIAVVGLALAAAVAVAPGARLAMLGLGLVVVWLGLASLGNWRLGLTLFLVWLVFEDLPRKYLGNNMVIYFAKDVLVGLSYVAFLVAVRAGRERVTRMPFALPFILFLALGVVLALNPASPSLLYSALGLKLYFYYVPLCFLGYALAQSEADLHRLLLVSCAVALAVGALGIAQGIIGLHFLNPEQLAPELEALGREIRRSPSGAVIPRATSVFVSEGRQGSYMLLAYLLGAGTSCLLVVRRHRAAPLALVSTVVALAAVALHGSRSGVMYAALTTIVMGGCLLLWWRAAGVRRPLVTTMIVVVAGAVAVVGALALQFPEAVAARWAFYSETISPWSPTTELGWRVWGHPVGNFRDALADPDAVLGRGIGTASIGAQYVWRVFGVPGPGDWVESGFGTLLLELGPLGPVLWIAWAAALVGGGVRVLAGLRGSALFPLGLAIVWFALLLLFPFTYGAMNAYQNFLYNAYFWLLTGVLFRLPALAEAERDGAPGAAHAAEVRRG